MTARTNILPAVKAALEASSLLTGITAVIYDGSNLTDIEEQLRTVGAVIVLPPIISLSPQEQAAGSVFGTARFVTRVSINPTLNATLATPLVFDTLRNSVSSVLLSIAADEHGDRYKLVSDELSDFDSGLLTADLIWEKGCQINPVTV